MPRKNSLFQRPKKTAKTIRKSSGTYPETLTISDLSHEGRGIARHEGKTIFVSGALPNETVRFEITEKHRRFDEARCTEIITASEQRTEPGCDYYGQCGGCDMQHMEHEHQIPTKQQLVINQLERLGKFTPEIIETPLASEPWQYRRSGRIGINQLMRDGSPLVGFRRRSSNKLLNINHCPVLATPLNRILKQLPDRLAKAEQFKEITHAELTQGDQEGALTLRVKKTPETALLDDLTALAESVNFKLYLDNGKQITPYNTEANLAYHIPATQTDVRFRPGDFIQVNAQINQQMIERALNWLDLQESDHVLDLFCGVGNFTLPIATQVERVVGVEGVEEMTQRAGSNAQLNKLSNCEFHRADLSKDLTAMPWHKLGFNKALLDPPRTGALEAIKQLEKHQLEKILYVSCNPAALARDGAELIQQGYRAQRFCVMDMFPHTSHVESMVLFERVGK